MRRAVLEATGGFPGWDEVPLSPTQRRGLVRLGVAVAQLDVEYIKL